MGRIASHLTPKVDQTRPLKHKHNHANIRTQARTQTQARKRPTHRLVVVSLRSSATSIIAHDVGDLGPALISQPRALAHRLHIYVAAPVVASFGLAAAMHSMDASQSKRLCVDSRRPHHFKWRLCPAPASNTLLPLPVSLIHSDLISDRRALATIIAPILVVIVRPLPVC